MMGSLRQATKNTMFDQWLDAVTSGTAGGSGSGNEAVAGAAQTGKDLQAIAVIDCRSHHSQAV
eukprot:1136791-Pelagomonas_calceolata.AAC.6